MKKFLILIGILLCLFLGLCACGEEQARTQSFSVTYTSTEGGKVEGEKSQIVEEGKNGSLVTAVPSEGFKFEGWSDGLLTPSRQEKDVRENLQFIAFFSALKAPDEPKEPDIPDEPQPPADSKEPEEPNQPGKPNQPDEPDEPDEPADSDEPEDPETKYFTVRYETDGNGWIVGETQQTVEEGKNCKAVTAVTDADYMFDRWSDGVETETRQDQNIHEDMTVTAYFKPIFYTVRYVTDGNGYIEGEAVQTVKPYARSQDVTAVPNEGYEFVKWSDGYVGWIRTDIVSEDVVYTAIFQKKTLTVQYYATSGGKIEGQEVQKVLYGESTSLVKALPDEFYRYRYHFLFWSDGLETEERQDKITEDVTYYAQFGVFNDYTVDGGGKIVGNAHQKIIPGTEAETVTAVADEGYVFTGWSDLSLDPVHNAGTLEKNDWETRAYFEKIKMTFAYNYGGNDHAPTETSVTIDRNKLGEAKFVLPKREGYTFCGWFADDQYDLKVVNEDGKLMLGYYTFTLDTDTLYAKWQKNGEAESLPVYKVLLTMTDEIHASLYSSVSKKDELVDYKMTGFERKLFAEIYEWFKEILVDWFQGIEIFEVDLFYTTEPIGTKENRAGKDNFLAGTNSDGKTDYSLEPNILPEIYSLLGKYHSILNSYSFQDKGELLKTSTGSALDKYGSVSMSDLYLDSIARGVSLISLYEKIVQRDMEYGIYVMEYLHEFTHTAELHYRWNEIYDYHKALSFGDRMTVTKLYLLNELEIDGQRVGIPTDFWEHKIEVAVAYLSQTKEGISVGKIIPLNVEDQRENWERNLSLIVPYGSEVSVRAEEEQGYRFIGWSDGVKTEQRTDKFISRMNFKALYEKI